MTISKLKGYERQDLCAVVALLTGYKEVTVRKVRNGERENETILDVLISVQKGETELLKKIAETVPLRQKISDKRGRLAHETANKQLEISDLIK